MYTIKKQATQKNFYETQLWVATHRLGTMVLGYLRGRAA